jgi:hypothetical protein
MFVISAMLSAFAASGTAHAAPIIGIAGYRVDPPQGWVVKQNVGPADLMMVDPTPSNLPTTISLTLEPLGAKGNPKAALRDLVDGSVEDFRKGTDNFKLIGETDTVLAGEPAIEVEATYDAAGTGVTAKLHEIFAIHGTLEYTLVLLTDTQVAARTEPVFAAIRKTFSYASLRGAAYVSGDGYKITPPSEWTVYPVSGKHSVYFVEQGAREFGSNVYVSATGNLLPAYTAERIYSERDQMNLSKYPTTAGFTVISQSLVTIAGVKAVDTVLLSKPVGDSTQKPLRMRNVMIPHDGVMYEIMAMCLESKHATYDALFSKVIESMQLVASRDSL